MSVFLKELHAKAGVEYGSFVFVDVENFLYNVRWDKLAGDLVTITRNTFVLKLFQQFVQWYIELLETHSEVLLNLIEQGEYPRQVRSRADYIVGEVIGLGVPLGQILILLPIHAAKAKNCVHLLLYFRGIKIVQDWTR